MMKQICGYISGLPEIKIADWNLNIFPICFSLQNNKVLSKSEGKFAIFLIADSYELADFKNLKKNHDFYVPFYTLAGALIAGK